MLVQGNFDELRGSGINKDSPLFIIGVLEKFLAEVISKGIYLVLADSRRRAKVRAWVTSHQLNHVGVGFKKDHLHVLRIAVFKFLLEITAAMLVFAELIDISNQALKRGIGKAICCAFH